MGTDKALVEVDGQAMVLRVTEALRATGATEVACIGGNPQALGSLGLVVVDDEWPGQGPLGGLTTALGWSNEPTVLVAGCDQPWLDAPTLGALVEAHRANRAMATVYGLEGTPQPLPGVYDADLRPGLLVGLTGGQRALSFALRLADATVVRVADPRRVRDVDRPQDLSP